MTDIDLGYAVRLPPKEAIAYFKAKGFAISWNWWEVWQEANAQAFTVAKAARLDILEDIRAEMQKALEAGLTERDFIKNLEPTLKAKGWWGKQVIVDALGNAESVQLGSPWRLKTIYRTNKRVALNAGRCKFQKENAADRPYLMYVAVMDSRTRRQHAILNGKVFRRDDPIWKSHYPPNGFGCRCRVRALSEAKLKRRGLTVQSSEGQLRPVDQKVGVDKQTGEEIHATGIQYVDKDAVNGEQRVFAPDPGWSYTPCDRSRPA